MLGKGLESLIPQKGNNNQNASSRDESRSSVTPLDPARELPTGVGSGAADLRPADELPPASNSPFSLPKPLPVDEPIISLPTEEVSKPVASSSTSMQPKPSSAIFSPKAQLQKKSTSQKIIEDNPAQESVFQIEVEKIEPNPGQPRRVFDQAALQDMAHSIREFGILQPLVVTKIEKETPMGIDISYQLIAGERRLMAAKLLGLRLVPAIVRKVGLEREKLELAIIENIQRENLNPLETARAFQRLQEEFRMTQREIAAKMGKSREVVANTVRLLDLPLYVQEALGRGELSESHARMLLAIDDPGAQKRLFDEIIQNGLTTRDVKERVKAMTKPRPYHHHMTSENLPPEVRAMQETLSISLGAPVEIQKNPANNGKITITFYSAEELDNILRRLGKEED
jgi:ParB family chromosome partitioning protein